MHVLRALVFAIRNKYESNVMVGVVFYNRAICQHELHLHVETDFMTFHRLLQPFNQAKTQHSFQLKRQLKQLRKTQTMGPELINPDSSILNKGDLQAKILERLKSL